MRNLLLACLCALTSLYALSQELRDFSKRTDANKTERSFMLNLLRKKVRNEIDQDALFVVKHFKVSANYAWLEADAGRADGQALVFPDETFDCCHVEGLYKKVKGRWTLIEYGTFSTDCWYCGIASRYPDAPEEIFTGPALLK